MREVEERCQQCQFELLEMVSWMTARQSACRDDRFGGIQSEWKATCGSIVGADEVFVLVDKVAVGVLALSSGRYKPSRP